MFHDEWLKRLNLLVAHGERVAPRGQETFEELDAQFTVLSLDNVLDVPARGLNYRFMVAEWLWMMFGRSDVDSVAQFNSVMRHFSDDGIWLTGAYGPHIRAQMGRRLALLKKDPDTRQAVIEIPRPQRETKDEPCTLSFQYFVRGSYLNCIVTMRSSDAWLGIPYDIFTFTMIQNCFAGVLDKRRGWLSLRMGSSHLYARDKEGAETCLNTDDRGTIQLPALPGLPPAWLEDVLTRRENAIPYEVITGEKDPEWLPYAKVLQARTSDDARAILRSIGVRRS